MQRHFMPQFYEKSPMHYDVATSGLQCYSPVPLRDYRRITYSEIIVEFDALLRFRKQGVWNLLWLTTPEVDDALKISNTAECIEYRREMFPLLSRRYPACHRLSKSKIRLGKQDYLLEDLVKRMPSAEFWHYVRKDQRFLADIHRIAGDAGVASMEKRANESEDVRVVNPLLHHNHIDREVPAAEATRTIQRTYEYRVDWLTRVTEFLRGYVEDCGFSMPRLTLAMDVPKTRRLGAWHRRSVDCERDPRDVIGISPAHTGTRSAVATLIHEIAHGIAGPLVSHDKHFWDICARLGLSKGSGDEIQAPLLEQVERIKAIHDPYPGAVWRYEWPEVLS